MVSPVHFAITLAHAIELFRTSPKAVLDLKAAMRALVAITKLGGATVTAGNGVVAVDATVVSGTVASVLTLCNQMEAHAVTEVRIARGASAADLLALVRALSADPGPAIDEQIERLIQQAVTVALSLDPEKKSGGHRPVSVTQAFEAAGIIRAADQEAVSGGGTGRFKQTSDLTKQVETLRQNLEEERELVERLRRAKRQLELANHQLQKRAMEAEARLAERPSFFGRLFSKTGKA